MSLIDELMKRDVADQKFASTFPTTVTLAPEDGEPPTDPNEAVRWMNARHCVVSQAGKTIVITPEFDPEIKRRVLRRSAFDDIRKRYSNRLVCTGVDGDGKKKWMKLGHHWLDAYYRRQYKGIVCAPNQDVPGYYNLWQGFSVEPKKGDWSLMDQHIQTNICAGNADLYHYVRRWLAFAIQMPDTLPEVALVLRGRQGTGKGVFARGFGSLFGQHFLHLARSRNLVGNFNSHLRDAIVVFADEAFLADDKDAEGVLKALITEPELGIEAKFQDLVSCRNLIHLIVASNNDRIINAAPEERRFCVLDVGEAHMQDQPYFEAIAQQMKEAGGREAMLYDLQRENLTDFNPRKFPITKALQDQKLRSFTKAETWWLKRLQQARMVADTEGWPTEILRDDLLNDYRMETGLRKHEAQDLRNAVVKLLPEGYPRDGSRPMVDGKRKRTWLLPPLADCRTQFAKVFGFDDCWDDD